MKNRRRRRAKQIRRQGGVRWTRSLRQLSARYNELWQGYLSVKL